MGCKKLIAKAKCFFVAIGVLLIGAPVVVAAELPLIEAVKAGDGSTVRSLLANGDAVDSDLAKYPVFICENNVCGVACGARFDACSYICRFCSEQWHSLALHVCSHEGAICIVVL